LIHVIKIAEFLHILCEGTVGGD